jgi:hypothetical protein
LLNPDTGFDKIMQVYFFLTNFPMFLIQEFKIKALEALGLNASLRHRLAYRTSNEVSAYNKAKAA